MSGYKPGYSEEHSPWYADGKHDANLDAQLVSLCPPWPPNGPNPAKVRSGMYRRGYDSVPQVPHMCTDKCKKDGQR